MRVIEPWTSTCSTVAIWPSGTLTTVPTGSVRSVSTDVTWSGSRRTTIAAVPSSSGELDLRRRRAGERAADLLCDLGGREADADRLVRVGRDAGSPACPCDRSDLRLRSSSLSASESRGPRRWPAGPRRGRRPTTMTLRLFEREPGGLGDRDVVAVGLDRGEQRPTGGRVRRRGRRPVREADGHPGAVRRLAARARRRSSGSPPRPRRGCWSGRARPWGRRAGSSRPAWPARARPPTRRRRAGRP